jgi:hypothetical protein
MVKGLKLTALRNPEYAQFMSDTLGIFLRNDPQALAVAEPYSALKAESEILIDLLNPDKGSAITAQLEAADHRRDEAITGINLMVSSLTHHYDPATRNHALMLQRSLQHFGGGGLSRENYQSETAGITAMLADWATKPELVATITALNLLDWTEELRVANKAFNELYILRNEETSAVSPVKVRDKRVSMSKQYFELRDLLVSHHNIQKGAAPYGATVNQLNALIAQYKHLLASRKGKSGDAEDAEEKE